MEIRNMIASDWDDVERIYQEGIDTNLATFETKTPTYEYFEEAHIEGYSFLITENDKIIGWCALSPISKREVYKGVAEVSIYIDKNFHRKGVGTMLLTYLIEKSEKGGFWTLQSGIFQDNVKSIALHEKCGFRLVGYREKIAKDKLGQWRNTVILERRSDKIL